MLMVQSPRKKYQGDGEFDTFLVLSTPPLGPLPFASEWEGKCVWRRVPRALPWAGVSLAFQAVV